MFSCEFFKFWNHLTVVVTTFTESNRSLTKLLIITTTSHRLALVSVICVSTLKFNVAFACFTVFSHYWLFSIICNNSVSAFWFFRDSADLKALKLVFQLYHANSLLSLFLAWKTKYSTPYAQFNSIITILCLFLQ